MSERTTVRLPADLIIRAKRQAASQGRSLTSLIEDGVRHMVEKRATTEPIERILPPVSAAKGGLMPGIDLNDIAALQEIEDFATLRRDT